MVALRDTVKPDARAVVSELRNQNIEVYMITGDTHASAKAVGLMVGIDESHIHSQVLPGSKATKVKQWQTANPRGSCLMIGDGINDAPALTQADLGVAVGKGSHVSVEAADIVFVNDKLTDVLVTIDLCRHIMRRIEMNLWWALGYNMIGIPLAAGVLFPVTHVALPSSLAGFLMAISSVSVVISSLMINLYTKPVFNEGNGDDRYKDDLEKAIRPMRNLSNLSVDIERDYKEDRIHSATAKVMSKMMADCASRYGKACSCKVCKCIGCCNSSWRKDK
mmetsp:Transcript_5870/g.11648  ORF Transcript_5870/g.11648 Transcript_5870/m.11648 type:complete len:278 (-) Transcript_5870:151-984(-)